MGEGKSETKANTRQFKKSMKVDRWASSRTGGKGEGAWKEKRDHERKRTKEGQTIPNVCHMLL